MSAPIPKQNSPNSAQKRIGFLRRHRGKLILLASLLIHARLLVWCIQFGESRTIHREAQARDRFRYATGLARDISIVAYLRALPGKDYDFPAEIRRASAQIAKSNHMSVTQLSGLLADARKDAESFDAEHIDRARFALLAGDHLAANSAADDARDSPNDGLVQRSMLKGDAQISARQYEYAEIDYRAAFQAAKDSPPQLRDEVISKLARVLARNRKFRESAELWRQALDIRKKLDGPSSQTATAAQQWATLQTRNQVEFSIEHIMFRQNLTDLAEKHGPYSHELYYEVRRIAHLLIDSGHREESEQYILLAIEMSKRRPDELIIDLKLQPRPASIPLHPKLDEK